MKWVPAPEDCAEFLGPWLAQRQAQGAGPEDRVFPSARRKGLGYRKAFIEACWEKAAPKHVGARERLLKKKGDKIANEEKPTMTWYQATRHSFVSRYLLRGASLDEVSAAVGHSSPASRNGSTTTTCAERSRRSCARGSASAGSRKAVSFR